MKAFLALILVFLVACTATPTGNVIEQGDTPEQQDTVIVKDCHEEQYEEPYDETVTTQQPLEYEVVDVQTMRVFDEGARAVSTVTLRNADTEAGSFTVEQTFVTPNGTGTSSSTATIAPAATAAFTESFDLEYNQEYDVTYSVLPGMKSVERTVTRYRTLTRTVC